MKEGKINLSPFFLLFFLVAMTPAEWQAGESMFVDFARNGGVLYAA